MKTISLMSHSETHAHASSSQDDLDIDRAGERAIEFQLAVIKSLGLTNETVGTWIDENSVRLRRMLDTDERLKELLDHNQWDDAVAYAKSRFVH